jgi:hypothetical protein
MYSTCLFCHQALGTNQAIEHFPVGRRLAFDSAKGRLWVVCRKCERWNLTPLEERWEAIEECERAFRATKLRVSTDHVGLARLGEGMELVRIGEPQRPEMAAWRYGDQFGRRRHRKYVMVAGGIAAVGTVAVTGTLLGLISIGAVTPVLSLINAGRAIYRNRAMVHLPTPGGGTLPMRLAEISGAQLQNVGGEVVLRFPGAAARRRPWWEYDSEISEIEFTGMDAVRAAGVLLPRMNPGGGSKRDVARAVQYLEEAPDPVQLFRNAADDIVERERKALTGRHGLYVLSLLPNAGRLALEMAAHEDSERRALEGELHLLEAAWKDAEEIAGIADDMFLPPDIDETLARMKRAPGRK